jgi:hypothetical protein
VEFAAMPGYIASMSPAVKTILELMASWPAEDQEELSELAREIEARRTGVYRLSGRGTGRHRRRPARSTRGR